MFATLQRDEFNWRKTNQWNGPMQKKIFFRPPTFLWLYPRLDWYAYGWNNASTPFQTKNHCLLATWSSFSLFCSRKRSSCVGRDCSAEIPPSGGTTCSTSAAAVVATSEFMAGGGMIAAVVELGSHLVIRDQTTTLGSNHHCSDPALLPIGALTKYC